MVDHVSLVDARTHEGRASDVSSKTASKEDDLQLPTVTTSDFPPSFGPPTAATTNLSPAFSARTIVSNPFRGSVLISSSSPSSELANSFHDCTPVAPFQLT
ncbi:hypothetical protein D8B26_007185 [Coccidioides posadasii str. Silveira]|uniref:uncharacterized protein n=1 Tax=Coccidioides posadasii (strain RMSCC 757 / Silveira) TaxID=443226 RepID=UPI001BEDBFA5|nr:hypothetical protein D8B26_007185 [Coccidioides posadasii str. Silveira]